MIPVGERGRIVLFVSDRDGRVIQRLRRIVTELVIVRVRQLRRAKHKPCRD
jgi:hypothetical protein